MRKKTHITIALLIVFGAIFLLTGCTELPIKSGRYVSTDTGEYKDAYLTMKNDCIQFGNIDLNAIFSEKARMATARMKKDLNDEEIEECTDFNKYLVENSYHIKTIDEGGYNMGMEFYLLWVNERVSQFPIIGFIEEEDAIFLIFFESTGDDEYTGIKFVRE